MLKLPLTASAVLVTLSVVACSGTTVITTAAADGGATPSGDASPVTDDGGTTTDAGKTPDAGASYGMTSAGLSCDPGTFAASASCSIPGTYQVLESDCTTPCGAHADFLWTAEVTVSGSTVKLTNGSNRSIHCELTTDCDCVESGGGLFRFTSRGFLNTGKDDCGSATGYYLAAGTKQ